MYRLEVTGETPKTLKENFELLYVELFPNSNAAQEVHNFTKEVKAGAETAIGEVLKEEENRLDADGMKWDERIHAPAKVLTTENKWRRKRGVSEELVQLVKKEQLDALSATTVTIPPAPQAAAVVETPVATQTEINLAQAPFGAPTPDVAQPTLMAHIAAPVVAPTPLPPAPDVAAYSFSQFLQNFALVVQHLIDAKKIDANWVSAKLAKHNVSFLYQITSDMNKSKALFSELVAEGLIKEVAG